MPGVRQIFLSGWCTRADGGPRRVGGDVGEEQAGDRDSDGRDAERQARHHRSPRDPAWRSPQSSPRAVPPSDGLRAPRRVVPVDRRERALRCPLSGRRPSRYRTRQALRPAPPSTRPSQQRRGPSRRGRSPQVSASACRSDRPPCLPQSVRVPAPNRPAVSTAPSSERLSWKLRLSSGPIAGRPKLTNATEAWAHDALARTMAGGRGPALFTSSIILLSWKSTRSCVRIAGSRR